MIKLSKNILEWSHFNVWEMLKKLKRVQVFCLYSQKTIYVLINHPYIVKKLSLPPTIALSPVLWMIPLLPFHSFFLCQFFCKQQFSPDEKNLRVFCYLDQSDCQTQIQQLSPLISKFQISQFWIQLMFQRLLNCYENCFCFCCGQNNVRLTLLVGRSFCWSCPTTRDAGCHVYLVCRKTIFESHSRRFKIKQLSAMESWDKVLSCANFRGTQSLFTS